MKFLETELVKKEVEDIDELQRLVDKLSYTIELTQGQDLDIVIEYFHTLYALIEKQHVVYTRLSLSKDPEAMELAEGIKMTSKMLGMENNMNVSDFYRSMKNDIKEQLIHLGEDIDSPLED